MVNIGASFLFLFEDQLKPHKPSFSPWHLIVFNFRECCTYAHSKVSDHNIFPTYAITIASFYDVQRSAQLFISEDRLPHFHGHLTIVHP